MRQIALINSILVAYLLTSGIYTFARAEEFASGPPGTVHAGCKLVNEGNVNALEYLQAVINYLLLRDPPDHSAIAQAYLCLVDGALTIGSSEDESDDLKGVRKQLAAVYLAKAFVHDPSLKGKVDSTLGELTRGELIDLYDYAKTLSEVEVLGMQDSLRRQVKAREWGYVASVGYGLSLMGINDSEGNQQSFHHLVFLFTGAQTPWRPHGIRIHIGFAAGVGKAAETPGAFVFGPAIQVQFERFGIMASGGWRKSTTDRARQNKGLALGVTYRLFPRR